MNSGVPVRTRTGAGVLTENLIRARLGRGISQMGDFSCIKGESFTCQSAEASCGMKGESFTCESAETSCFDNSFDKFEVSR